MDMIIKGRHMEVRPDIRAYAEEKVGKVARILNGMVMSIEVELYHEKNRKIAEHQVAEVTVYTKGPVIRARESATDMKAAIDLVADKLSTQAKKFKGKLDDRHSPRAGVPRQPAPPIDDEPDDEPDEPSIVKTKTVELKPMHADEAIMQMDLLGHDFFVFAAASDHRVNIPYRRRDGDYGLIVPRAP
jgi:putative sigma-54 modulation protein